MSGKVKIGLIAIAAIIIVGLGFLLMPKSEVVTTEAPTQEENKSLEIVSTDPASLEGATISPAQSIIFTFNKVIPKTEFKHQFEPEISGYEIEALNGPDSTKGTIMKINFKQSLQLGKGYTLKVSGSTRTEKEEERLGEDYFYHFKTIQYKGV